MCVADCIVKLDHKEISRDLSGILSDTQQVADSLSIGSTLGETSEESKLLKKVLFRIKNLKAKVDQECWI